MFQIERCIRLKKILICDTALCSANLGDEIILDSIYQNMDEIFSQGTTMRIATHVENFNFLQMLRRNEKVRFCQNADWKFICGSNLLTQKKIGKINGQWMINPVNASVYSNSIFVGVGATKGNIKMDAYATMLYKKVLSKTFYHSVRDNQSKKMVESLGCKAINTGCPTLWGLTPEVCEQIPVHKAKNCVLTVSGFPNQRSFDEDARMLSIILKNYDKVWAWIQTIADEEYLKTLPGNESIIRIYTLKAYRDVLKQGDVDYIGTRLHGGVFALQNGVRSLVISIDHRADGFHKSNNLPILKRANITDGLEEIINNDLRTEIYLDQKSIARFKDQFK